MANENGIQGVVDFLEGKGYLVELNEKQSVFKKRIKVTLNKVKSIMEVVTGFPFKRKQSYRFDEIKNVELITTEKYGAASPFEDSSMEYVYSIKVYLQNGKVVGLFNFVDRDPKRQVLIGNFVSFLRNNLTIAV